MRHGRESELAAIIESNLDSPHAVVRSGIDCDNRAHLPAKVADSLARGKRNLRRLDPRCWTKLTEPHPHAGSQRHSGWPGRATRRLIDLAVIPFNTSTECMGHGEHLPDRRLIGILHHDPAMTEVEPHLLAARMTTPGGQAWTLVPQGAIRRRRFSNTRQVELGISLHIGPPLRLGNRLAVAARHVEVVSHPRLLHIGSRTASPYQCGNREEHDPGQVAPA